MGYVFDREFYRRLGYNPPTRCRQCRAARKATMREARGVVVTATRTPGSFVLRSDEADCAEYLCYNRPEFRLGDVVRWQYDPGPLPPGARLRLAYRPEKV